MSSASFFQKCFSELNNKRGIIKLVFPLGEGTFVFVDYIHLALRLSIAVFLFAISAQNRIKLKQKKKNPM